MPGPRVYLQARVYDPVLKKKRHCWSIVLERWDPNEVYREVVTHFEQLASSEQKGPSDADPERR